MVVSFEAALPVWARSPDLKPAGGRQGFRSDFQAPASPCRLRSDTPHRGSGDGRLTQVLGDWCPPFSGYHLY